MKYLILALLSDTYLVLRHFISINMQNTKIFSPTDKLKLIYKLLNYNEKFKI